VRSHRVEGPPGNWNLDCPHHGWKSEGKLRVILLRFSVDWGAVYLHEWGDIVEDGRGNSIKTSPSYLTNPGEGGVQHHCTDKKGVRSLIEHL